MEMTKEMLDRYGKENLKYLEDYKAKFLGDNKLDTQKLQSPKEIPVGTILTQYWLNSMTYYMVTRTTAKTVEMIEMRDIQIWFDHDGGGTGTRWCMPNFEVTFAMQKMYKEFVEKTGLDIFNMKEWPREEFDRLSKEDRELYFELHNFNGCSKKYTKRVKASKNGGFYIPGLHTGFMCYSMGLWDGTPDREYYGD